MFWKRKSNQPTKVQESKLASFIRKCHQQSADRLNARFAQLSAKRLKAFLLLFCVVAGGFSFYLIMTGVSSKRKVDRVFQIDHTAVPRHFDKAGDPPSSGNSIDPELFSQIQSFQRYLDSLLLYDAGAYDSLIGARPGLIDTLETLKEIYLTP